MIDIRRKRQAFHQSIRMSQREALKKAKRQIFSLQQQHQELLNALNQPFSFCENWEQEKHNFWDNGPSNRQDYYSGPFHFIEQTSQALKDLLLRFETDADAKLDISYHLIQNLPFLVPPPNQNLDELPKSFIELCMFILRNPQHDNCDKENFVNGLPHETIARCLLKYFAENWAEIKTNKCSDIVMNFFIEFNKHKNFFTQYMYNDLNFEFLLEESIKEIINLIQAQISVYNSWNTSQSQLRSHSYENFEDQNLLTSTQMHFSEQEKMVQVMKYTTFLCNILLLSPIPNFNIKQVRNGLKTIAFYLYRKILLNEYDPKFHIQAEFCVSILLGYTCQVHLVKQIQVMTKILNNQIQRIQSERCQKDDTNQEVEIDQIVLTKEENLDGQDIIEKDEGTLALLNRMSLLMISNMAQNSNDLRYKHVQKWLYCQMRFKEKSVFKIQNPEIIRCFLSLLKKLIINEQKCPSTYKSYSYGRVLTNQMHEQVFRIKASICKLVDRKGFQQLLNNRGIKEYNKEFCKLLCSLMYGMDEFGDVSAIVLSLFKFGSSQNQSNLDGLYEWEDNDDEMEESDEEKDNDSSNILSAIRVFIFKLSMQFLQKTYKYLPYKQKEELMLHLINSDNLSQDQTAKYLTIEERLIFKKHIHFKWQSYNTDEDEFINEEVYSNTQSDVDNQKDKVETQKATIWEDEDKHRFETSQETQI